MAQLLFEIGVEEIPARMIPGAQAEFERRVVKMLAEERLLLDAASSESFSTPRRLAVRVRGVKEQQDLVEEEMVGPSVKVGFKDGVPTPAAEAFARKAGVRVSELRTVTTAKGEYLQVTVSRAGQPAKQVIETRMPKEIASLYWAKTMYWREGKPERFVRPVRWMLGLLDEVPLLVSFGGFTAGDVTYGHRVLYGAEPVVILKPEDYEAVLEQAHVLVNVQQRQNVIRKALDRVCRTVRGARWREDHALVDKMTHMTEWPAVLIGSFDPEFLSLPEEVLVTVMRDHQNYFAVEDAYGNLAPYFLAVLNTRVDEAGTALIRQGNERVLRARFNDARFFWEFDQRTPLVDRVPLLAKVTFQKDLGSYASKAERVRQLCARLVSLAIERNSPVDAASLDLAARLAKTDLTTELVKEFTELQGRVGGLYARAQQLSDITSTAIYDHYRPESMEAPVARTAEGQLLSIADKADTIAGMFGLGLEPTGSKDPFALRRAGNGIIKTLAESDLPLTLEELAQAAETGDQKMLPFLRERLDFYLREAKAQAYDVVAAVLAVRADDVRDAIARAHAVTAVRASDDFAAVSMAFKRMKNILAQAEAADLAPTPDADPAEIVPAQQALLTKSQQIGSEVDRFLESRNYIAALQATATMRPQIDTFFAEVMVMDPEPATRRARLALLRGVLEQFSKIADFSEIVVAG